MQPMMFGIRMHFVEVGVPEMVVLEARNMECRCCFSRFTAVLEEIANSRSANAEAGLGICKSFARNGTLSNGFQGTPHKGVSCFLLDSGDTCVCVW